MAKGKQFAVLGLGRFGRNVALTLETMGYDVLAVDKDESIVEDLAEDLTHVVSFDIRDERALMQAGIANCDTVVIASANLEASLMATMLCKEMDISEIVVKAVDERHAGMARRLGATQVIFSERDTARRLAMHLVSDNAVDYIDIAANIKVLSLKTPKSIVGKNLIESNLRATYNVNVIAIIRKGTTIVTPPPTYVFAEGDKIFLLGSPAALTKFEEGIERD
ncbi:MAG: TrkA family potassium uptake protein [Selenomonadaceae bacterium]|nr:TrkA family potassium uptake protein [Selenomonadaceae bacterium]